MRKELENELQTLPELLKGTDGTVIQTVEQWREIRRPELLDLFREHIYGVEPSPHNADVRFRTVMESEAMEGQAVRKTVEITISGPGGELAYQLHVFLPANLTQPVPAFLLINNRGVEFADPKRKEKREFWPAEMIVSRGYAAAVFHNHEVDPDEDDGFLNGIHGVLDTFGEKRPPNAWGTIAAWAWGASRALDALEREPMIDAARVALVGHSRGGKTALWAGALDERFAMVVSNNSGSTGAALARGKVGERIDVISSVFTHWFCANYRSYSHRETELPVDQHMLLALIAPRLLYVASASEDEWADPQSEFRATVLAEEAYRLHGFTGLGTQTFPPADTPVFGDKIGYHVRTGGHALTAYDWTCFLDFADRNL